MPSGTILHLVTALDISWLLFNVSFKQLKPGTLCVFCLKRHCVFGHKWAKSRALLLIINRPVVVCTLKGSARFSKYLPSWLLFAPFEISPRVWSVSRKRFEPANAKEKHYSTRSSRTHTVLYQHEMYLRITKNNNGVQLLDAKTIFFLIIFFACFVIWHFLKAAIMRRCVTLCLTP